MTDSNNKPPSTVFKFLEQLGLSRQDVLAENAEPVLAAKMTVAGFIDQANHFLSTLKTGIMNSTGGLDINTARLFLEASKQSVEYAINALDKYEKIRDTSRSLTKLKLDKAANDNDVPDEVTEFVHNRPAVSEEEIDELDQPANDHIPHKPTDKKLN
ncbi:MAG: hypothetical protein E6R04_01050 [Spirochaetes bacterium]|nr:MAG: hypothetical protein E6R04_01050 [Spirochaetota bacterium]